MQNDPSKTVRIQRERSFHPHHFLLSAACTALDDAEDKRDGYVDYQIMAITFSALTMEALCNSFGLKLITRWKEDFESARPMAKLNLVCQKLGITMDVGREPWATALWLTRFRNSVVHAKPQLNITEDRVVLLEEHDLARLEPPLSELERLVTLDNAKKSVETVLEIINILLKEASDDIGNELLLDGWSGSASGPRRVGMFPAKIPTEK